MEYMCFLEMSLTLHLGNFTGRQEITLIVPRTYRATPSTLLLLGRTK